AQFGPIEKTYRVFVEELPPAEKAAQPRSTVRVLTRVGVPIFMDPERAVENLKLGPLKAAQGKVSVDVHNEGNVHERIMTVAAQGQDGGGKQVFEGQVQGWYVLAGSHKAWQVPVPADACARVRKVQVTVKTDKDRELKETLETPAGACG